MIKKKYSPTPPNVVAHFEFQDQSEIPRIHAASLGLSLHSVLVDSLSLEPLDSGGAPAYERGRRLTETSDEPSPRH